MSSVRRPEYSASQSVELGRVIRDSNQSKTQAVFEVRVKFAVEEEPGRSLSERQPTWTSRFFELLGGTDNPALTPHRMH
jgi:hypothetical protein